MIKEESFYNCEVETNFSVPANFHEDLSSNILETSVGILFRSRFNKQDELEQGYYFGANLTQQTVFVAKLCSDKNTWQILATKKIELKQKRTYKLTVDMFKDHITCYVNKQKDSYPVIDILDNEFSEGLLRVKNDIPDISVTTLKINHYEESLEKTNFFQNPLVDNSADPDVIYSKGTYYMYPTTTGTNIGGIKVYTSTDLVHWTDKGLAMTAGSENWGTEGFWAPDLIERDGKFYMYYTAEEHICASVSESPLGPYKQVKFGPMHPDIKEIDAHVFNDDGEYYFYFVRFDNANIIYGAKLNDDMISIDESTVVEVVTPSQEWELDIASVNEGPYMLKKNGKFFLTYSGSHFESPMYGVGYAVSNNPLGPFEKYKYNPIMQSNSLVHGAGHHSIAVSPDQKELFVVYHCHPSLTASNPRKFCIDRMRFTTNAEGEDVLEIHGPTITPQDVPSGSSDFDNFIQPNEPELFIKTTKSKLDISLLPKFVKIHTSKSEPNQPVEVKVEWDLSSRKEISKTKYVVEGLIVLPENIKNVGNINLNVKILVQIAE